MSILAQAATSVNTSDTAPLPAAPLASSKRRYKHTYEAPSERFHMVANDEAAELIPSVGRTAYAILECLRGHLNHQTGQCNPSLATIAREIGAAPSTVTNNLKYLEQGNVIFKVNRDINHERRDEIATQHLSNQYLLLARSEWTLDKVTRKGACKKPAQNRSTLVEKLPDGLLETPLEAGAKQSANKKNLNEKKETTPTQQRAHAKKLTAAPPSDVVAPSQSDSAPHDAPASAAEPPAPEIDAVLLARLLGWKVRPKVARDLLENHDAQEVRDQIEWMADRDAKNPPGVLVQSIRESWEPPPAALARRRDQEAARRAEEERVARAKSVVAEVRARSHKAQQCAREDEENAHLEAILEAMPPDERAEIEREAQAQFENLAPFLRKPAALAPLRRKVLRERLKLAQPAASRDSSDAVELPPLDRHEPG